MQTKQEIRIAFKITGNGITDDGNAMPKIKLTAGQQWMPRAKAYVTWKSRVLTALLDATKHEPIYPSIIRNIGLKGKPFQTSDRVKAVMAINIAWKDGHHGDPEGVFGSIADALFSQDKNLDCSGFASRITGRGEVDVELTLQEI